MTKRGHCNTARDTAGVIVTMRHRSTGELQSVHRPGGGKVALRQVLELFAPSDWCCQSISTPRTILADVKGTRKLAATRYGTVSGTAYTHATVSPESALLGAVGRLEFLP